MRKYNIYGIGGALVDTEVQVSDKFLLENKIEKGSMTLVNEHRQTELLQAFASMGLKLVQECGGSVCNSVVAASALGARTFFSGKVADDIDGELFIRDLQRAGVGFSRVGQESGTTGKCLVMVTNDAERTMNTFLGVSEMLSSKEIDYDALKNSEWLYVEGYLVTDERRTATTLEAVQYARRHGVKIAVTLSDSFVVENFGEALRDVMGTGIDLLFCNRNEALSFAKTENIESAVRSLTSISRSIAITDGENGALIFDGKSLIKSQGLSLKPIDTNGAGDMFAGTFLYALNAGKSYEWASELANYCAAKVVMNFGPRLRSKDFLDIKQRFDIKGS